MHHGILGSSRGKNMLAGHNSQIVAASMKNFNLSIGIGE